MPRTQVIDPQILQAALEGLEAQRQRIAEQIARVRERLGSRQQAETVATPESAVPATRARKRRLSAAGRKAIAEAARKRWAAQWKREKEAAERQAEIKARRVLAMAKARKALAASRKAARKAAARKAPVKPETAAVAQVAAEEATATA